MLNRLAALIERGFLPLAVGFSALALVYPPLFAWIRPHIALGLGIIMFGMGLTLEFADFLRVFVITSYSIHYTKLYDRLAALIERGFLPLAVGFSVLALVYPPLFAWIRPHIALGLGIIMFGMGLTLEFADFLRVFREWRIAGIGIILQYRNNFV